MRRVIVALGAAALLVRGRERGQFADPEYWEATYKKSGRDGTHEWFFGAEMFVPLVQPLVALEDRVLQVGCGNSLIAEAMSDAGYLDVTSLDFSPTAIEANRERYPADKFPALKFVVGDVFAMSEFATGSIDAVLDKGTWDAIPKTKSKEMMSEVRRVLRPGGLYLVLTFSRPGNALDFFLDYRIGWKVDNIVEVPNPVDDATTSIKNFYFYVCRNEDRDVAWLPAGVGENVTSPIRDALSYQEALRRMADHSEL